MRILARIMLARERPVTLKPLSVVPANGYAQLSWRISRSLPNPFLSSPVPLEMLDRGISPSLCHYHVWTEDSQ